MCHRLDPAWAAICCDCFLRILRQTAGYERRTPRRKREMETVGETIPLAALDGRNRTHRPLMTYIVLPFLVSVLALFFYNPSGFFLPSREHSDGAFFLGQGCSRSRCCCCWRRRCRHVETLAIGPRRARWPRKRWWNVNQRLADEIILFTSLLIIRPRNSNNSNNKKKRGKFNK